MAHTVVWFRQGRESEATRSSVSSLLSASSPLRRKNLPHLVVWRKVEATELERSAGAEEAEDEDGRHQLLLSKGQQAGWWDTEPHAPWSPGTHE